jgi:hypothetical protein
MKRFSAVFLAALLMVGQIVPAYAAGYDFSDWVPPIPSFVKTSGGLSHLDMDAETYSAFTTISGDGAFKGRPSLLLLSQEKFNAVNEANGTDYDRQFCVYYIELENKVGPGGKTCFFRHKAGPRHQQSVTTANPMEFGGYVSFSFRKCIYDYKTQKLVLQPGISKGSSGGIIRFTYVLGSNLLAEPSKLYPGYSSLVQEKDGKTSWYPFETGTIYYNDGVPHYGEEDYNWWLWTTSQTVSGSSSHPGLTAPGGANSSGGSGSGSGGSGSGGGSSSSGGSSTGGSSAGGSSSTGGSSTGGDSSGGSSTGGSSSGGSSSGGSSTGGSSTGGDSSGGSSTGGSSTGGDSGNGSNTGGGTGDESSGGSSSDKGSGPPNTWFGAGGGDGDLEYKGWEFFDPFKYNYTPFPWDKDYDPLAGYTPGKMPEFPRPGNPNASWPKDPYDVPDAVIRFEDFIIAFGGGK